MTSLTGAGAPSYGTIGAAMDDDCCYSSCTKL